MKNTAHSFLVVTGFSIATRLASFIFKMWMSRSLGAEIVGVYQIALSVLLMLFTVTAGAPTVLSRKVAEAGVTGDTKRQNALLTASVIMGLTVSSVICGVLYALGNRISFLFSNPNSLPLFFIMLPTLITSTLYASLRSWFWGRKKFVAFSSTELIDEIVKIILSIVFAGGFVGSLSGATGIALALTVSDAFCVLVLAIIFFATGGRFKKPQGFKELTRGTIPLSATRIITSLGASLTAFVIPQMLVKSGLTIAQATAEYGRVAGMALPLIMAPVTFIGALAIVLIPDVASLRSQGDTGALRTKLSTCVTFGTVVACFFFSLYLPHGTRETSLRRRKSGRVRIVLLDDAFPHCRRTSHNSHAQLSWQREKHASSHPYRRNCNDSMHSFYAKIHRHILYGSCFGAMFSYHRNREFHRSQKGSRLVFRRQEKLHVDFAEHTACGRRNVPVKTSTLLCKRYYRNRGRGRVRHVFVLRHRKCV